jgi:putative acetyltransferase
MIDPIFREIKPEDNEVLAHIIRKSIEDLRLPTEGTAHSDPTTNNLYSLFQTPKSYYFVVESCNQVLGGCGLYPTKNLPIGHVEMVRFFLTKEARGLGLGHMLMVKSIEKAIEFGFSHVYIETFPTMAAAVHLYKKFGFEHLKSSLGESGHFACNVWMRLQLNR